MKNYKFYLSGTNYINISKNELKNCKNVVFIDDNNSKGKIITIKRYDGKRFKIIVPLDMLEESEVENEFHS